MEKNINKKIRFYQRTYLFLLASAFLLNCVCIIIVAHLAPRGVSLDFDYYGVIVGVLSILVTVLIGWNIYSVIDLKKIKEEQYSTLIKIQAENLQIKKGVLLSRAQIEEDFAIVCGPGVKERPYVISHTLKAIYLWAEIKEYEKANNCVKLVLLALAEPAIIKCSKQSQIDWISILKSTPNQQLIKGIENIYPLILKLDVY